MRLANRFILLGLAIFAALASSGQTVYVQPMRYDHYAITQQASIGAGVVRVTAPSAYLEIGPTSGATKGLLGPRLTSTERDAISSPADGLLIYNTTTKKYQYYDGGSSSWKDLGSGAVGGSGVTQLGTSPWGLTKLNDSTYVVDSMKVLTKYQGEKFRDSLAALINLRMLKSDSLTAINPTGYVTGKILKDSAGGKVDTAKSVKIDTTGKATGKIPKWDATCECFKMAEDSVGTSGGGSSGSGAFSKLEWFPSDEFAPEAGDSLLVHDSFPGKFLDVYRDGIKQPHIVGDTGWTRMNDTTIKVTPPFAATDKFWHIEARDSTAYTQLVLQDPGGVPSTTIAYATSADGGNNGGSGTSRTWSHTVSSGTDRYLFVGFVGDTNAGNDDVSSVTFNGVSMTFVSKQLQNVNSGNRWTYVYGLANPASGAHNVVVTFGSSHWILGGSIEYTGVQGIDTYNSQTGFVTNLTSSITTGVDNCWTFIFSTSNGNAQTAGSGSTLRLQAADNYWTWFDSGSAVTPAGSKSMNTARPLGAGITHIMISIKPY